MNERGTPERSGSSRVLETPDQILDSFVIQSLKWDPLQKASGALRIRRRPSICATGRDLGQ